MAANTPPEPDGSASAKSQRTGRPTRSTLKAPAKASARADRALELEARNQRMAGPRKPMGPPLEEGPARAAARKAVSKTAAVPTDPKRPSAAKKAAKAAKKATAKKATSKKVTAKKSSAKKGSARKKRS